jgi:membrane associated rhomboid family serine protease
MLVVPYATDRKRRTFPSVTVALILINTFVLFLQAAVGEREALRWAFTPAKGERLFHQVWQQHPTAPEAVLAMLRHATH